MPAPEPVTSPTQPPAVADALFGSPRFKAFAVASLLILIAGSGYLFGLFRYALDSSLYSHIVLIPVISGYLIWQRRALLPAPDSSGLLGGIVALFAGLGCWAWYASLQSRSTPLLMDDRLALTTAGLLCLLLSAAFFCLGHRFLRVIAFPVAFLIFMVPFPEVIRNGIDAFFQHTSAAVAYALLKVTGTPVLREGLHFQLAGIQIQVAPECSGIHSTLVLFITSLLAGQMFFKKRWNRFWFALFVIPLAACRNGFRIATISWLCTYVGSHMINHPIHHKGGPIFFVLSLVPFFLFLMLLRRLERRSLAREAAAVQPAQKTVLTPTAPAK